jgi:tryptophan-rich sensory protein
MTRFILLAATAVIAATGVVPASAQITTFANYSGVGGANMYWQRTGTTYSAVGTAAQIAASQASATATAGGHFFTIAAPTSTTVGAVASKFTFLNTALYVLGALDASYTFDATANPGSVAQKAGGFVYQPIMSGTFSFIYTGTTDLHVNRAVYHTGANLLSATFASGTIAGQIGATSGSANASTSVDGETIAYTSDFIDFTRTFDQDLSISLSSITRSLAAVSYQALRSFATTTTGSFSTDPLPVLTSATPEPASWALLVAGFGLVGVARRGRRVPA